MRHREIEAARLAAATKKMNQEMREVRNRQNKYLAELAVKDIDDATQEIIADEVFSPGTGNSIGSWIDHDPWAVEDYVENYRCKKELEKLGKPTDPLWIRWMREVRDVREKNFWRKRSGKPLRPFPKPPQKS